MGELQFLSRNSLTDFSNSKEYIFQLLFLWKITEFLQIHLAAELPR